MATFRQLALRVVAESGLEKESKDDILSPEYVFKWLKARYQRALDAMPFGTLNAVMPEPIVTVAKKEDGLVSVVKDSDQAIGNGTSFTNSDVGRLFRIAGQNIWYRVVNATGQTLTLDTVYVGESQSNIAYVLVSDIYAVSTIRWITGILFPGRGELEELGISKLNELAPYRSLAPSYPRYFSKRLIEPTGERLLEIYPFPDAMYRLEVIGYVNIGEPTLTGSPNKEFDEEMLVVGAMADAFQYRAQLAAGRKEPQVAEAFDRLAQRKLGAFNDWIRLLSNRDDRDTAPPRIQVRMTHQQYMYGLHDSIIDAYDHVWNKP